MIIVLHDISARGNKPMIIIILILFRLEILIICATKHQYNSARFPLFMDLISSLSNVKYSQHKVCWLAQLDRLCILLTLQLPDDWKFQFSYQLYTGHSQARKNTEGNETDHSYITVSLSHSDRWLPMATTINTQKNAKTFRTLTSYIHG